MKVKDKKKKWNRKKNSHMVWANLLDKSSVLSLQWQMQEQIHNLSIMKKTLTQS